MRLLLEAALLLAFVTPLAGCAANGNDPLGCLTQSEPSATYDAAFWKTEAEARSVVWSQAVDLCREEANQRQPNCTVVLSTALIQGLEEAAGQPFPEYGTGRGSTGVPDGFEEAASDAEVEPNVPTTDEENEH